MPRLLLSLAAALALPFLFLLGAARADQAGADRLRAQLWEFINLQNALVAVDGEDAYRLDGIDVTPLGESYQVLFRNLRIVEGPAEEGAIAFGDIALVMTPAGEELYNLGNLVLPGKITIRDNAGEGAVVTTQLSRFEGLWSARYLSFLGLDAEFSGAQLVPLGDPGSLESGRIAVLLESVDLGGGLFDQKGSFEVLDMVLKSPDLPEGGSFSIDRLAAASRSEKADLGTAVQVLRRLADNQAAALETITSEEMRALVPWLGDMDLRIQRLQLGDGEGNSFSMEEMQLAGNYDSRADALGSAGFDLALLGMKTKAPDGEFEGVDPRLFPDRVTLSLGFLDIPNDAILNLLVDVIHQNMGGAGNPDMSAAGEQAAGLLSKSGAKLLLNEFSFSNQLAALAGAGEFRVNEAAAYLFEGGLVFELVGVEQLQGLAQEMLASNDPEKQETGQALLGTLGMMMIYSQGPEKPQPSVPEAMPFAIRLNPDGLVTVNGLPVFGAQ